MHRIGVTIGKFMPLHKGHELMIEFGSKMVDELYVIVSGKLTDEIKVSTRYEWLLEFVEGRGLNNVAVVPHIDNSPEPVNIDDNGTVLDRKFQDYWVGEFKFLVPGATDFISSDKYGLTMANLLNINWIPVDPKREIVPISATAIRNEPEKYFDMISDVAKKHYIKRVAIVGPESSGKSTMVQNIAMSGLATTVPEYGRTLSEAKNVLTENDFYDIVSGQKALMEMTERNSEVPLIVTDTEAYTTYLFTEKYLSGFVPDILEIAKQQKIDHYIVMSPEVEWVDDGTRVMGNQNDRVKFFNDLIDLLKNNGETYTVIRGTQYQERTREVYKTIVNRV